MNHEHNHDDEHDHYHDHNGHFHVHAEGPTALRRAILVTFVFMMVEFVGGYYSNSLALVSDASHMLTDIGAMLLSLFAFWVAKRPSTPTMSFGYHRAEILGALASGLIIWIIAGFLVYQAIIRIVNPPEVKGPVVLLVAVIGLAANLISMKFLFSAKKHSLNVRAAYLHVLFDSLGSVAAIITGAVLWIYNWRVIDPIVTVVLAVLMLVSSWELIKESIGILMESTPSDVDVSKVKEDLSKIEGVREVHDLHVWAVSSGRLAMSAHLISIDPEQEVLTRAYQMLQKKYGIVHTTIQVEHPEKFSSSRCYDCAK